MAAATSLRMQGTLAKYGPGPSHLAFISGPPFHRRHVVLIGGLTDGLLFAPYAPVLASRLQEEGWSLVQGQLSSSYQGFGTASLNQDAHELKLLVEWLVTEEGSVGVVLMGHSTGCQDIARFMQLLLHRTSPQAPGPGTDGTQGSTLGLVSSLLKIGISNATTLNSSASGIARMSASNTPGAGEAGTSPLIAPPSPLTNGDNSQTVEGVVVAAVVAGTGGETATVSVTAVHEEGWTVLPILGTILQAPVSDREWLGMHEAELAALVNKAQGMVKEDRGQEIVGRLTLLDSAPITAQRLCDLHDKGGDDDMFSMDLTPEYMQSCLAPVGAVPSLVLASGADEAVPDPSTIPTTAQRIAKAINAGGRATQFSVVVGAPHNLEGYEEECATLVTDFLKSLPPLPA